MQEVSEIATQAADPYGAPEVPRGILPRLAMIMGVVFYIAGTLSFIGIFIAFFAMRLFAVSDASRIAFMILFTGLFCAFQGLILILITRGGEAERQQNSFLLEQIRRITSHSVPPAGTSPPEARD